MSPVTPVAGGVELEPSGVTQGSIWAVTCGRSSGTYVVAAPCELVYRLILSPVSGWMP